jgi:hypothetical protein
VFVYIAGPLTLGDTTVNIRNAMLAGNAVRRMGAYPYVPHYNAIRHFLEPCAPEWWIEEDLAWLSLCDALLRLPGASVGADREVAEAERLRKPVFHSLDALREWLQTQVCEEG